MSIPRAPSTTLRRNRFATREADSDIASRTRRTNARFHRLLDYCAGVLAENVRAADELSDRVGALRGAIERRNGGEDRCN
jgi:hypothetical protein